MFRSSLRLVQNPTLSQNPRALLQGGKHFGGINVFRKITKNIYERSWKRKDGTTVKTLYFWLMIEGKVVHQRAVDPDNPKKIARTKRDALNFLAKWRVKLEIDEHHEKLKPKEITWGKFVKDYYEPIAQAKLRHYARSAGYQISVLNRYFESKLIHTITHFDVEKALLAERQRPVRSGKRSNRTINRIIERAHVIFTLAVAEGLIDAHRNPMNLVAKLEEVPKVKQRLSFEDEENILEACHFLKLDYVASATIILLETGMRPWELSI